MKLLNYKIVPEVESRDYTKGELMPIGGWAGKDPYPKSQLDDIVLRVARLVCHRFVGEAISRTVVPAKDEFTCRRKRFIITQTTSTNFNGKFRVEIKAFSFPKLKVASTLPRRPIRACAPSQMKLVPKKRSIHPRTHPRSAARSDTKRHGATQRLTGQDYKNLQKH